MPFRDMDVRDPFSFQKIKNINIRDKYDKKDGDTQSNKGGLYAIDKIKGECAKKWNRYD